LVIVLLGCSASSIRSKRTESELRALRDETAGWEDCPAMSLDDDAAADRAGGR
jgi:hypothetical protein